MTEELGGQVNVAKQLGISQVYVSDLLNRRRDFSDQMLDRIGLRRTVIKATKVAKKEDSAA
jgi:plasmid maintenance system antidote protein VapI